MIIDRVQCLCHMFFDISEAVLWVQKLGWGAVYGDQVPRVWYALAVRGSSGSTLFPSRDCYNIQDNELNH